MNIGDLKKRITLQYSTRVSDGGGGSTVTWNEGATIYAAIWPMSANEQVQAMQTAMTVTHRIRVRYRRDIKASWRIAYAGRYFNIVSIIDPNMAHKFLDILVKEGAA